MMVPKAIIDMVLKKKEKMNEVRIEHGLYSSMLPPEH
jgi:hypothetical protein